jgi:hypothetical protein
MTAISRSEATIPFPRRKISTKSRAKINVARHTGPFHAQVNTSRRLYSLFLFALRPISLKRFLLFSLKDHHWTVCTFSTSVLYLHCTYRNFWASGHMNGLSQMVGAFAKRIKKQTMTDLSGILTNWFYSFIYVLYTAGSIPGLLKRFTNSGSG